MLGSQSRKTSSRLISASCCVASLVFSCRRSTAVTADRISSMVSTGGSFLMKDSSSRLVRLRKASNLSMRARRSSSTWSRRWPVRVLASSKTLAMSLGHWKTRVLSWMSSVGSTVQSRRKRIRWVAVPILLISPGMVSVMEALR